MRPLNALASVLSRRKGDEGSPGDSGAVRSRLSRALSVDLEVSASNNLIQSFAAVRWDTGARILHASTDGGLADALGRMDRLSERAEYLVGHNLFRHDLPHLRTVKPDLGLLSLPAVDTLWLNPLAFPKNPYHHLVKHYQDGGLRRGRLNDPELDARLTLDVLDNQLEAFLEKDPDLLAAWHWLSTCDGEEGFDLLFSAIRGSGRPTENGALGAIRARLEAKVCRTAAASVVEGAAELGWELCFALSWLSVAGGNSVVPPWVLHQFPGVSGLLAWLRDTPCHDAECKWCRERHDACRELERWFGFPSFRPEPADEDGRPMQQAIVETAMAGNHALAILPTGTGKSLCYQIPALSRYDKMGVLTVVISPLVALMADQVAGLASRDIDSCVTVNGLLSMPERADALDRVRLGDASILLISPEQLRSRSVRKALEQRQIGAWVVDEAHCLSSWGHDFRPDYRYLGRFIRERVGNGKVPPVLCLTATAKPDVVTEIVEYFRKGLSIDLKVFDGGSQRANLGFVVVRTSEQEKFFHVHQVLEADLPEDGSGGAIVYCSTQRRTEELAEFLQFKGMDVDYFHGGLSPEVKKAVQASFIGGDLRVVVCTNAFGMGIDKPDVRVVAHADIPGSLENYLQEAGRAGRDRADAKCVLLYAQEDVEKQFGLSAMSKLSRREIDGVLRALRNLDRKGRFGGEVVATPGEILTEDHDQAFQRDAATDDTRVRTAVSWLEEAVLLTREENHVQVFPSSLRVHSAVDAMARLEKATITPSYRTRLLRIYQTLVDAHPDEGISTDELMGVTGMTSEQVRQAMYDLESYGIASNDTALTAFVHAGVQGHSRGRFGEAAELEKGLIDLLREMAPDMGKGEVSALHLRVATQQLKDLGYPQALPERLRRIVRSIAGDGRGEGGGGGSLTVRARDSDTLQVTLNREWGSLVKTAELRRDGALRLLRHLLEKIPQGARGVDLLAETTMGDLLKALQSDMVLLGQVRHPQRLMERSLMWLHEQEVIRLNKGLAVFRPAMTIRLGADRRRFLDSDYEPLKLHYDEQTFQVHVMAEYAEQGLESMATALGLALDYFSLPRYEFTDRWFPGWDGDLFRQTTPESYRAIVDSLNNPYQRTIVADDRQQTNVLVLAGPGSGKTRVLVHRIAYLIRVKRENPRSILALAYNRHAAVEIRKRLADLIGDDARGVIVLTCHALAMRLVGASFSGRAGNLEQADFRNVLLQAVALLRGDGAAPEEADEFRNRLLGTFRWILVDEYQDIAGDQYDLISALAGRTLADEDEKLHLFAVGDDDQNIYAFGGSSVKFIRRFEEDYKARPKYLVGNYRSTGHIIAASNAVIEPAAGRMKDGHLIRVNREREGENPGGDWAWLDPVSRGRVQVLPVGNSPVTQAQAAVAELQRLAGVREGWDWSRCAVIAREWSYLAPVRGLCESLGIPVQMANEDFSGLWFLRETRALVEWVQGLESGLVDAAGLKVWLAGQPENPWNSLLLEAVGEFEIEVGNGDVLVDGFVEWLAEWSREARQRQWGLLLLTAHRAKGLEFDHVVVLDGAWEKVGRGEDIDAPRRLYYVAMTRARTTLTLCRLAARNPMQESLKGIPSVLWREQVAGLGPVDPGLSREYLRFSLRNIFLSYGGYRGPRDGFHRAVSDLSVGDELQLRRGEPRWELLDLQGRVVGQLSRNFHPPGGKECVEARVLAVVRWDKARSEAEFQNSLKCESWEAVVPELVFQDLVQVSSEESQGTGSGQ